jgi:hypothetical protein
MACFANPCTARTSDAARLAAGVLVSLLGFTAPALTTPVTAACLVLVKMLYLHEEPENHG